MNNYTPIIGMEIHVELSTKSKMFCRCSTQIFGEEPNSNTCPVCLGLPGALPYPNKKAIESCIAIALALNCEINNTSYFDRKNYFYPDLPKGFQISQFPFPFGKNGYLEIPIQVKTDSGQARMTTKKVRITRVHMEEDTGKNTHTEVNGKKVSLLDFNRSSIPLVEIVTEPDIHSGEEAKAFLTELQKIVRYLGVSDADMEKGNMRLEPNISLTPLSLQDHESGEAIPSETKSNSKNQISLGITIDKLPPYKVEVKNINSFRFVEKAINYEIARHAKLLDEGKTPTQETRGWNENRNETVSQRSKEEAHDYRYFPEPDIPPIEYTKDQIANIKNQIPELPIQKTNRYIKNFELSYYDAEILTREKSLADYFEAAVKLNQELRIKNQGKNTSQKIIANWLINKKVNFDETLPAQLVQKIIQATQTTQIDEKELSAVIRAIINENPAITEDYKAGKVQVIGFFIGQVKQKFPTADATHIKSAIEAALK